MNNTNSFRESVMEDELLSCHGKVGSTILECACVLLELLYFDYSLCVSCGTQLCLIMLNLTGHVNGCSRILVD